MDKLTDLKLQAFALWMAERKVTLIGLTHVWMVDGKTIINTVAELTALYAKETEEQYVS